MHHARQPRLRGQAKPDRAQRRAAALAARRSAVRTLLIAAATAAVVALAGGGEAYWAAVPAALLAAGTARGHLAGGLSALIVAVAAIGAERAATHGTPSPTVALMALIPAASVAILLAVRERLERECNALRASALSDPLTGVANRRALLARIEYEIARHGRNRRSFAVLMLDLDGFKQLNDRFGHPAGDDLLREVAGALARAVRDQDTVARVGGDEFCVLAPETDQSGTRHLVGRVETAVAQVVAGVEALGAGVGAALFPHDGTTADELIEAADQRLLGAKRETARPGARRRRRRAA